MNSTAKSSETNILMVVLTVIGVLFLLSLIMKIAKDIKKNTSTEIISKEGFEILKDETKRTKLREAVDNYHETGKWDKLENIM
jgi:hypothetical protein